MNVNSLLKKEGIKNIQKMKPKEINTISKDIAIKLCLAFPEHNLSRQELYDEISNVNMFRATMASDSSGAKYIYNANSIYFNSEIDFEQLPDVAMHECIHFLQMRHSRSQMGLYNHSSGLALNEAAVQLMASYANMCDISQEKLYGINIQTNSPTYYPLECTIIKQMAFFTGYYPLYTSTLNSNDIFKNTFISRFNKRIYNYISKNLDKLLSLENDLHYYTCLISTEVKEKNIRRLNSVISAQKKDISDLFFKIQNYIMKNCFCIEFSNITTSALLHNFKKQLYDYKNVIGYNDNYTFYNEFYCDMMNVTEVKKKQIENSNTEKILPTSLVIIDKKTPIIVLFHNTIIKIKKLIGITVQEEN